MRLGRPAVAGGAVLTCLLLAMAWGCAQRKAASAVDGGPPSAVVSLPAATVGQVYARALTVQGGHMPYRIAASAGPLQAAGMDVTPEGRLVGVPTQAGTVVFSVVATEAGGAVSVAQRYRLTIRPAVLNDAASSPARASSGA